FRVAEVDRLLYMFHNLAHAQRNHNPSAQVVPVENRWINPKPVALYESFHESDQLCQEVVAASFPGGLHLIENVACGTEDIFLHAELFAALPQVDFGYAGHIRLSLDDRRKFRS